MNVDAIAEPSRTCTKCGREHNLETRQCEICHERDRNRRRRIMKIYKHWIEEQVEKRKTQERIEANRRLAAEQLEHLKEWLKNGPKKSSV